jgi:ribosome-associated toxin RatA of RatAB toxin-antitoxin module
MKAARRSVEIDISPARFYALLIDFESYPGFVPNQSSARVVERGASRWRVEFELSVARKLRYTLDLVGEPERSLRWSLVQGDMMRENEGGWTLEELPGGTTRATYEVSVSLGGFVPRSISNALVERTMPANIDAFKREAERRGE